MNPVNAELHSRKEPLASRLMTTTMMTTTAGAARTTPAAEPARLGFPMLGMVGPMPLGETFFGGLDWGGIFWIGCAIFVVLRVLRGWQEGLPRQIFSVVALVAGFLAGWLFAPGAVPWLRGTWNFPDPVLRVLGGLGIGILVWLVINVLSRLLFRTTAQQTFAPTRLIYGVGGAIVGLVLAAVYVVVLASGARLLGTVAEAGAPRTAEQPGSGGEPRGAGPEGSRAAGGLPGLKRSLEAGPAGGFLEMLDPVPAATYRQLKDITRVAADPRAQERLLDEPRIRRLAEHPKITALRDDPEIVRALEQQDYLRLVRDPRFISIVNDPQLQAAIRDIDWPGALSRALRGSPPPATLPPAPGGGSLPR